MAEFEAPVALGFRDRSSAAETRRGWCESGPETVLLMRAIRMQRDCQTVQTQPLEPQCFPVNIQHRLE